MDALKGVKQPSCNERKWRRQQPAKMLKPPIGIQYFRCHQSNLLIQFHKLKELANHIGREIDIRVEDNVIGRVPAQCCFESKVVSRSKTQVRSVEYVVDIRCN